MCCVCVLGVLKVSSSHRSNIVFVWYVIKCEITKKKPNVTTYIFPHSICTFPHLCSLRFSAIALTILLYKYVFAFLPRRWRTNQSPMWHRLKRPDSKERSAAEGERKRHLILSIYILNYVLFWGELIGFTLFVLS